MIESHPKAFLPPYLPNSNFSATKVSIKNYMYCIKNEESSLTRKKIVELLQSIKASCSLENEFEVFFPFKTIAQTYLVWFLVFCLIPKTTLCSFFWFKIDALMNSNNRATFRPTFLNFCTYKIKTWIYFPFFILKDFVTRLWIIDSFTN